MASRIETWPTARVGRLKSANILGLTVAEEYERKEIEGRYTRNDYAVATREGYGRHPRDYQWALTADVQARGIVNPVTADSGYLTEGYHRYAAARQAGLKTMRVRVIE